jgi:hypothetical protein
MGESFGKFFNQHPFLAIFIAVFMILPMIGAVIHIVLKALGRKGIDNSPPSNLDFSSSGEESESTDSENKK